ncbi:TetR family transcriptional regulator [Actinomycetospora succinea]|uniref:TetR family transcriptional regulator n=1 Tax=Actinomycetospora succinea TaxID=663603 RepID=A0A4R6VTC5_9PSEU|nr:TetR/AcrR family transcriptional regulator [Actinomycetospora succinea]TDQ65904.1 TetR family transcriptional regulator [Actinomycetospora succinea]
MAPEWFDLPVPRWSDRAVTAPLQARARATRRELLLAAARRFADQGYHLTSLSQVVADGGRTKGALFFHFENKSALGWAVVDELHSSWEDIRARIAARGLDPLRALLVVYDAQIARLVHDPIVTGGVRVMREDPGMQADRHKWVEGWRSETEVLLGQACAAGLVTASTDPMSVSSTLLSTVVGHHYLAEVQPDGPSLWERMTTTWLALLPTLAERSWLESWSASGWSRRPPPDAATFDRARREDTA